MNFATDLEINGDLYTDGSLKPRELTAPGVTLLRLDVKGLASIRGTGENDSKIWAAGIVCAGKAGLSGYCTDLEPRHYTTKRLVIHSVTQRMQFVDSG